MPAASPTPPHTQNLSAWLQWLETLHPTEIELGLERVSLVAQRLALRERLQANGTRTVIVGGTNGKGSCVAGLAALASAQGWSVGSYSSPHFRYFNERIHLNQAPVDDASLVAAFQTVEQARQGVSLTYFEYTTLAALELFAAARLQLIVLEVGLGGRLDAVNILDAEIAIITSIDLDHQSWLGDTREAIGREKAGILRSGQWAVCMDPEPPQSLLNHAAVVGVQLVRSGHELIWRQAAGQLQWRGQASDSAAPADRDAWHSLPLPLLPLPSVVAALQAAQWLGLDVSEAAVAPLAQLQLPGRFQQIVWRDRQWLLDVAHNPAAAGFVAERLGQLPVRRTVAIMAAMADKDYGGVLQALAPVVDYWYVAGLPQVPRAAPAAQLDQLRHHLGLAGESCDTVAAAVEAAIAGTAEQDRLLVVGSFYTLSAVLELLPEPGETCG